MNTQQNPADELRQAAEEALIWQDEWDSQPSDGSAVQNFIDAASPRAVLAALDAAARRSITDEQAEDWLRANDLYAVTHIHDDPKCAECHWQEAES